MTNSIKDILLIQSINIDSLVDEYKVFFLGLLPTIFIMACIVEYFDRLDTAGLVKRALVSILILIGSATFYKQSIDKSFEVADSKIESQKQNNILLQDFLGGFKHWSKIEKDRSQHNFYKNNNVFSGTLSFLKFHLFTKLMNDGFSITVYSITQLCLILVKVVYSLTYYLGFGLIGIPCLIYLFPTMGNVLRGGILTYLTCIITPHVLVFILTMIGSEINKGYQSGTVIGGSMTGTVLLFLMTLTIAMTPLISIFILNGSGVTQAGAIFSTIGANHIMGLPKRSFGGAVNFLASGSTGKAGMIASQLSQGFKGRGKGYFENEKGGNLKRFRASGQRANKEFRSESKSLNSNFKNDRRQSSDTNLKQSKSNNFSHSNNQNKDTRANRVSSNSNQVTGQKQQMRRGRVTKELWNTKENISKNNKTGRSSHATISKRGRRAGRNTIKTSRFNKR